MVDKKITDSVCADVISSLHQAFTIDLQTFKKPGEKTYTQRSRLYVGNLPMGVTEQEVEKLFSKYGKPAEIFINKERGFGFVRLVSGLQHHFLSPCVCTLGTYY